MQLRVPKNDAMETSSTQPSGSRIAARNLGYLLLVAPLGLTPSLFATAPSVPTIADHEAELADQYLQAAAAAAAPKAPAIAANVAGLEAQADFVAVIGPKGAGLTIPGKAADAVAADVIKFNQEFTDQGISAGGTFAHEVERNIVTTDTGTVSLAFSAAAPAGAAPAAVVVGAPAPAAVATDGSKVTDAPANVATSPVPHEIFGATTAKLTIKQVSKGDAGTYHFLNIGGAGSADSAAVAAASKDKTTRMGTATIEVVDSGATSLYPKLPTSVPVNADSPDAPKLTVTQVPEGGTLTINGSVPAGMNSTSVRWEKAVGNGSTDTPTLVDDPFLRTKSISTLNAATLSTSGNGLTLATAQIFAAKIQAFDIAQSLWLSTSIATTKPDPTVKTVYSDAQALTVEGGVVNLYFSPFAGFYGIPANSAILSNGKAYTPFGDRGQANDRHYFFNYFGLAPLLPNSMAKGNGFDRLPPQTEEEYYDRIASGVLRTYFRDGIGAKMVDRQTAGATSAVSITAPTSTASTSGATPASGSSGTSYGIAGSAYFGVGIDGGLRDQTSSTFSGLLRLEALVSSTWIDKTSLATMYPGQANARSMFTSAGGRFSLVFGSTVDIGLTVTYPLGANDKVANRLVLGSITIKH